MARWKWVGPSASDSTNSLLGYSTPRTTNVKSWPIFTRATSARSWVRTRWFPSARRDSDRHDSILGSGRNDNDTARFRNTIHRRSVRTRYAAHLPRDRVRASASPALPLQSLDEVVAVRSEYRGTEEG